MEPMSPAKFKLSNLSALTKQKLKIGGVIAVVSLLLSCALYTAFKLMENQGSSSYFTVVLDCGSTGTRVSVYEWLSRVVNPGEVPVLRKSYPDNSATNKFRKGSCQYHCLQTKPGLDKFIGNASGVRKSLEPLIKLAKQWVPTEKQEDTPIYVLATAGLRNVGKEDAARVLDDVEVVLKDQQFFHTRRQIRVLSGKEEAYYGWVALNYKMDRLGNSSKLPTLGLLDLGGSSLQVALEGRKEVNSNQEVSLRDTSISNQDQVLSYSLEAFGLNTAFDRTVVMISQEVEVTDVSDGYKVKHPCLSSSVVQNYTCYNCPKLNLTAQKNSNKNAQPISVRMVGNPNWEDCIRLARAVATTNISISFPYSSSESPNSKVISPSQVVTGTPFLHYPLLSVPEASFHALSGFFAIQSKLKLRPTLHSTDALEKEQKLCSTLWINSSHSSEYSSYGDQFCFQVPYIVSLINDVFRLRNQTVTFGPADISWTLGAALSEGEFIWLSSAKKNDLFSTSVEIFSTPFVLFMVLLCLPLIVYCRQIKLPMLGRMASLPSYTHPRRQIQ